MSKPLPATDLPPKQLPPAMILLGLDDKAKRHASYFVDAEVTMANAAAQLMGMASLPVTDDVLAELAGKLPRGKIFGSGKAFVPFVGEALFEQLAAHLPDRSILTTLRASANAAATEASEIVSAKSHNRPKSWDKFAVGDLVLATEGEQEGWWEAVVIAVVGEMLTLRWRDWPDEPQLVRKRDEVALMHPSGPVPPIAH